MRSTTVNILLVEDNDLDVERIRRAFSRLKIPNTLAHAQDGQEALDALRGTGGRPRLPRPDIILLDLNMPRMGGIAFLKELRQDAKFATTNVCVLTTSDFHRDVRAAYQHHVSGYIVKPESTAQMLEALTTLRNYWDLCELP